MPSVTRSALVSFSAAQMFELVNDVDMYSEFLPGCTDSKVIKRESDWMEASLLVEKAGIKQWFTTHNQLTQNSSVNMALVDGPFKSLTGGWTFTPLSDEACKVELNLTFEFTNKLVELAFGKVFKSLANNMVQAFTERAKVVY